MLECINPNYIKTGGDKTKFVDRNEYMERVNIDLGKIKYHEVRCNKCLPCKLYKCYQKANRIMLEAMNRNFAYFVTLTFNEQNYKLEELLSNPLRQGQLFIKRLRKKYSKEKIKYFLTSELGTVGKRFHYHLIIFSDIGIFEDMYKIGETKEDTKVLEQARS